MASYNWKESLRKALTQAIIAFCTQALTIKRFPNPDEAWVALLWGLLAFATTLEKAESKPQKVLVRKLNLARKVISDSLIG